MKKLITYLFSLQEFEAKKEKKTMPPRPLPVSAAVMNAFKENILS